MFPAALSAHRAPGKKATAPLQGLGTTSTEADALTTRPRAGLQIFWLICRGSNPIIAAVIAPGILIAFFC